ncbi:hypothetical protein [uncultured Martelella sp.]|uniref:hypothetical protein n=1 Tax=uncultured Martelella sp. TaxID=392331 RepID=UPI0029C64DEF|nr:hypothetical protein [uncultured Martelella sp.]
MTDAILSHTTTALHSVERRAQVLRLVPAIGNGSSMTNARPSSKDRLESYRALVSAAVEVRDVFADADGMNLEVDGMDPGEPECICALPHACPTANRELILHHIDIPADLIAMLERTGKHLHAAWAENERLRKEIERAGGAPAKNYAAECAMKCSEPAFKAFMEARHALARPLTDDRVAARVRSILAISSRTELNTSNEAAARWRGMVNDFENWRKQR